MQAKAIFPAWLLTLILTTLMAGSSLAAAGERKPAPGPAAIPAPEARVDINRATFDELLTVPGMTRIWAGRILRFRPYRSKQDLLDRGIVTNQVYDRIKNYLIAHRDAH